MDTLKKVAALIIGLLFLYDFIMTLSSNGDQAFHVIGFEVSKLTYLAYLLATSISFLTYVLTKQMEQAKFKNQQIFNNT